MKHFAKSVALIAALALLAPTLASAVKPTPKSSYKGKSTEGEPILLKTNFNSGRVFLKFTNDCGQTFKGTIKIKPGGKFVAHADGEDPYGFGFTMTAVHIEGKWVSKRKATGRIYDQLCMAKNRSFAATRGSAG